MKVTTSIRFKQFGVFLNVNLNLFENLRGEFFICLRCIFCSYIIQKFHKYSKPNSIILYLEFPNLLQSSVRVCREVFLLCSILLQTETSVTFILIMEIDGEIIKMT